MAEEDILGSNLKDMSSKVEDVISSLKDLEKRLSNSNKSLDKNTDEIDGVRLNLKKMKDTLDVVRKSHEELTKTTNGASQPVAELGKKLEQTVSQFDELSKKVTDLGSTVTESTASLKQVAETASATAAATENKEAATGIGELLANAKTAEEAKANLGVTGTPPVVGTNPAETANDIKQTEQNTERVADAVEGLVDQQQANNAKQEEQAREAKNESAAKAEIANQVNDELLKAAKELIQTQKGMREIYANALTAPAMFAASSLFGGKQGLLGMGAKVGAKDASVSLLTKGIVGPLGALSGFLFTAVPMYMKLFSSIGSTFMNLDRIAVSGLFAVRKAFSGIPFIGGSIRWLGNQIYVAGSVIKGGLLNFGKFLVIEIPMLLISPFKAFVQGWTPFFNTIFKGVIPSLFSQFTRDMFNAVTGRISSVFTRIMSRISSVFSGGGAGLLRTIMKSVEFIFGEAALGVFKTAFRFGASIAKYIPFLSLIPTVIETIVSAFKKMETEGVGGVIKSIFVGLLKGVASFLTLGLSDFILDFEAMYEALSKPLDGIIKQLSGFFELFSEVFSWLGGTLSEIWTNYVKPIAMSIWDNALKPIFGILKKVGEIVAKLIGFVLILLTPVFAIVKFLFKVIFEVVKLLYDYVLKPLLDYLIMPVFNAIMTVAGAIFGGIYEAFAAISDGLTWLNENTATLMDYITNFFDEITGLLDEAINYIKEGIIGWFDWFGDEEAPADERQALATQNQIEMESQSPLREANKRLQLERTAEVEAESIRVREGITMSPPPPMIMPFSERAAGGAAGGGSPVIINNASTTNNNVSGGGGSSAIPVPLSPNPVHHLDPTRALVAT